MLHFFKTSGHLIAFGFILTFLSGFGQTFLVSLYVPEFQDYFELSDGLFSSFYAVATLGSAFTLSWLGRYIDKIRLTRFVVLVMLGFALSLSLLSQAYYIPILIVGLYGIRLFGQGLMTHTSLTSMARFFTLNRGKAIGFASLGHPSGEAVFPFIIVLLIAALGWRSSILVSAAFVLLMIPLILKLLMLKKQTAQLKRLIPARNESADELKAARPLQIIKSKAFWILAPSNFAAASIGTAIIFFQLKLGELNGWEVSWMAASFVAYALGGALSTLLAGWLTDRFSAKRLFPFCFPLWLDYRFCIYPKRLGSILFWWQPLAQQMVLEAPLKMQHWQKFMALKLSVPSGVYLSPPWFFQPPSVRLFLAYC